MRLSLGLLLPAIAGVAQAASESVEGFIFTASKPRYPETLTLTPEQARLVLAQQLDITQYHSLGSSEALEFVNKLGGSQQKLFDDNAAGTPSPRRLVVFVDSSPASTTVTDLKAEWNTRGWKEPSFEMPESTGRASAERLVGDMQKQIAAPELPSQQCALTKVINDSADECWHGKNSQILQIAENTPDFAAFVKDQDSLFDAVNSGLLEATFIFMPQPPSTHRKHAKEPWGCYSMPSSAAGAHQKRQTEALISDSVSPRPNPASSSVPAAPTSSTVPLQRLPALCYTSLESCAHATNNCSGHGACARKYGPKPGASGPTCYACVCAASYDAAKKRTDFWGGAACHKRDISAQFWIIAGFSALLVGLISWAVGMMFSIGNEKLPGVIGAGVSVKSR